MLVLCSHDTGQIERWRSGLSAYRGRYRTCDSLEALASDASIGPDDLVLLDMEIAGASIERILTFIATHPLIRIFAFSSRHTPEEGEAVIAAGARGYANRYMHPDVLAQAVPLVEQGEVWLGADLVLHLIRRNSPARESAESFSREERHDAVLGKLTPREREIACRIVQGKSNKVIARELGITERTIKAHLGAIYRKTGTNDRLQLALMLQSLL
ncbi:LuxR C-terminal-related transcriptional regulator [endosymbiont of unidentified scaly snail isolate Monju]|uniref:LuxR C-terminal-related transcriptional regulator n=1 Tax=endosymbiont of unidentified scaly snail isolate Monju TaxID=1248727 RepID=UPI0003892B7B|nr:response regulator transcription factor [endosymbiont of unidentified scaly snail isolate Monju]BAN68760.1 hypothetical protein EBS_0818 [endosymbiont of unidentified scaly snail isolate Monju]